MSRASVRAATALALTLLATGAYGLDPHMDPGLLPTGCRACHAGHGAPRSPMLPATQTEVCLACHGAEGAKDVTVRAGHLGVQAEPQSLSLTLAQAFTHPLSDDAYSRHEPGVVTCTSCHSAHRGMVRAEPDPIPDLPQAAGTRNELPRSIDLAVDLVGSTGARRSTRDPDRTEFELCAECHGGLTPDPGRAYDVTQLASPRSRSFHPMQATANAPSPSLVPGLSGREISCTDCHGNSNPEGGPGPHASDVRYILRATYQTHDGTAESEDTYALCYTCHDRAAVLDSAQFPEHRLHVVDQQASCATCHDPHGATDSRAMIRFNDDRATQGVLPSAETGLLQFDSSAPGSGSCFLTCHGFDHGPEEYGGTVSQMRQLDEDARRARPSVRGPRTRGDRKGRR